MKIKLATQFDIAASFLYAANEAAQYLHNGYLKLQKQGIDAPYLSLYENMPVGGQFTNYYASSFFGAAACVFFMKTAANCLTDKFRSHATEASVAASAVALTTHELTRGYNGSFDWRDMGAYALALTLSYTLHKMQESAEAQELQAITPPDPK